MNEVDYSHEAVMLIGPPGQMRRALENKGYRNVTVWEQLDVVVLEFDYQPGDTQVFWLVEGFAKNAKLKTLGHSATHRSNGSRMTMRFAYDADPEPHIQRIPKPRAG